MFVCKAWNAMWYFIVLAAIQIIGCCLIPIVSFSSQGLQHAKSDTQAIPLLKRYTEALCPQKASLKSLYVPWCP